MKERDLLYDVRAHLSVGNTVRLFRMNVGYDAEKRIAYGIPGMSDLIGWRRLLIKPIDVGTELAVFCAIELKSARGKASREQINFIHTVSAAGGFAGIAHTVDDAREILHLPRIDTKLTQE